VLEGDELTMLVVEPSAIGCAALRPDEPGPAAAGAFSPEP
jgi:hypothetical protein